eukprot:365634-Chlamydomonas_euryale.AAC.14
MEVRGDKTWQSLSHQQGDEAVSIATATMSTVAAAAGAAGADSSQAMASKCLGPGHRPRSDTCSTEATGMGGLMRIDWTHGR